MNSVSHHHLRIQVSTIFRFVWNVLRANIVAISIVVFLWVLLWFGDGQQANVDGIVSMTFVGIALVIVLFQKPKRFVPNIQLFFAGSIFLFLLVSMFFSDDAGSTWFALLRWLDAFLVYTLFYSYSSKKTPMQMLKGLALFGVIAIAASIYVALNVEKYRPLPQPNLLQFTNGHHPLISLLLFVYPMMFFLWVRTKKTVYLCLLSLFFLGSVLTLSRAGVLIDLVCTAVFVFGAFFKKTYQRKLPLLITGIISAFCILVFVFPYKQTNNLFALLSQQEKLASVTVARTEYMRQAIVAFLERPGIGSGLGTFYIQSMRLEKRMFSYTWMPHSLLLEQVSDMGLLGACMVWLFFAVVLLPVFRRIPTDQSLKNVYIALASGAVCVVVFSMVDIPFGYIFITLIFWAILGVLGGSTSPSILSAKRTALYLCISILFLVSICGFLPTIPFTSSCNPIRMTYVYRCLKEANNNNLVFSKEYRSLIEFFHRKQLYTLLELSRMEQHAGDTVKATSLYKTAADNDPFSAYTYYPYFRYLVMTKQYRQFESEFTRFSLHLLPQSLHADFLHLFRGGEEYNALYDTLFAEEKPTSCYSLYYLIGLAVLPTQPAQTEQWWRFAKDAFPDYGHLYVEYANLWEYTFHDPDRARQILTDCQQRSHPAQECRERLTLGVSEPGSLSVFIRDGK